MVSMLFMARATQGATLFPQQIGIAATFNTEIAKKSRNISL
jgi:beta-glucosidase